MEELLRADCARCDGLCCVGLAFDRSAWFSFDKPANLPCRYLSPESRCLVHGSLVERGLAGCALYDCHGAGQRVTEMFSNEPWRQSPEAARAVLDAFWIVRQIHELLLLIREAGRLDLRPIHAEQQARWLRALEPPGGWTREALSSIDLGSFQAGIHAFLRSLRDEVRPAARRLAVVR